MKTKNICLLTFLSLFILPSCIDLDYFPCLEGSGTVYEEIRPVGTDLTSVQVSMAAEVYIFNSEADSLIIEAPENLLEHIETDYRTEKLSLYTSHCIKDGNDDIRIFIYTDELTELSLNGSGTIWLEDGFNSQELDLDISGSGDIIVSGNFDTLKSTISGSGDIYVEGNTFYHKVRISGSGDLNAFYLNSKEAEVNISGSGDAKLSVDENLDVRISGSGNVYYTGNPYIEYNITGSGELFNVNVNP